MNCNSSTQGTALLKLTRAPHLDENWQLGHCAQEGYELPRQAVVDFLCKQLEQARALTAVTRLQQLAALLLLC